MKRVILTTVLLLMAVTAFGQSWEFYPGGTYNEKITRPADFLRYDLGQRFTFHHKMVDYFEKLDEESDRVQYKMYGITYETRPLTYLIISSPENLARLDEIRENNLKLTDPRKLTSQDEAEELIKNNPAIAWMEYNVHGNEASGLEAAILTAYQLAAGTDAETEKLLKNLVIIIDPTVNPDGRELYTMNYSKNQDKNPNTSPIALERTTFRGGRTNHYNVDLNRDWAFLTQRENIHRISLYKKWMPQVAGDIHEMGWNSSYFFFPPAKPVHTNYPDHVKKWHTKYGQGTAAAFDKFGWEYFSKEIFDMFYPGYGDTWPTLNGAIGITFEQAGGGYGGINLKRAENDFLSLRDRLWHHFTASIATLKVTSDNKEERLRDFYSFFTSGMEEAKNGTVKEYIIPPAKSEFTSANLVKTLLRQGIEIKKSTDQFTSRNVANYFNDKKENKTFPAGSYIISLDQPMKRLIQTIFEQETALPDTFFYDMSSWTFPYATNVETFMATTASKVATEMVTEKPDLEGAVVGNEAGYAYLLPADGVETTLATYDLVRQGVRGGISRKEFTMGGKTYERGTSVFYVKNGRSEQEEWYDLHTMVRKTADKYGVEFFGTGTGFSEKGIDLGSGSISSFVVPKIAIVGGTGNIRHLLDHRYSVDFTSIDVSQVANLSIDDFNVVIVTNDISASLKDEKAIEGFKNWMRQGGVFVGWNRAINFALNEKVALAKFKKVEEPEKTDEEKKERKDYLSRLSVKEREGLNKERMQPGYFVKAKLDITHPLAYGLTERLPVMKMSNTAFELSDKGGIVGAFDKSPFLSGYVFKDNLARISDKGYLAHAKLGRGNVVLFSDDPLYREFLTGIEPLFLNAILLMPSHR